MPENSETDDDGVDWFDSDGTESSSGSGDSEGETEAVESSGDNSSAGASEATGADSGKPARAGAAVPKAGVRGSSPKEDSVPVTGQGTQDGDAQASPANAAPGAPSDTLCLAADPEASSDADGGEQKDGRTLNRAVFGVPVEITVCVGKAHPMIGDLLRMRRDALLPLDSCVSDCLEIRVRNRVIAHGELRTVSEESDRLAVRITQIGDVADVL